MPIQNNVSTFEINALAAPGPAGQGCVSQGGRLASATVQPANDTR